MSVKQVIDMWDRDDAPLHPTLGTTDYWSSAVNGGWLAFLSEHFPLPCSMLDFGCGDGRVMLPLLEAGYEIEGYDTCAASLGRLLDRNPEAVVHRTLPGKQYDAVIMLAVLIHYDCRDGMKVLRQAWDRVRPGGHLYANVPVGDEYVAGSLGLNVWPVGSIKLKDAEHVLDTRSPLEHQIFRKRES